MAFKDQVQGPEAQGFVELFEIDAGDSFVYYTSGREKIELPGKVFVPAPIKRTEFSVEASLSTTKVTVYAPPTPELTRYLSSMPIKPTRINISRMFHGDTSTIYSLFSGAVVNVGLDDNVATAECCSGSRILEAEVPRLVFSSMCQHSLFDGGCGLASGEYVVSGAVTVSGSSLICPYFADKPDGWFSGGYAVYQGDMRMITSHAGDTIWLQLPFDDRVQDGTVVKAYPGCDGTAETCKNKFDNIRPGSPRGFLGMPYIPDSNPVLWGFK